MENYSKMLEAHYSTETKVKKTQNLIAEAPTKIPKHKLFSNEEANKKIYAINSDIYEGAKKEQKKNEFNKSMYFKIFGGITLLTAGIAGIDRIKKFFKKS